MIDLRWLETKDGKVLQYRERPDTTYCWTEWETIPTVKTLTDEEIADFTVRIYDCRTGAEAHEIVLAILKKASEK
jgi:hypothetical protein